MNDQPGKRVKIVVRRFLGIAALCITSICTSSCVRTTIRSGLAPGPVPPGWEERWHHGFVFGLDEFPGPVSLEALCPKGWSEVDMYIDPMQTLIAALSAGVYTPSTVSVVCADPDYSHRPSRVDARQPRGAGVTR